MILPRRGRGTSRRLVEGYPRSNGSPHSWPAYPSTMLRMVPLPLRGRT